MHADGGICRGTQRRLGVTGFDLIELVVCVTSDNILCPLLSYRCSRRWTYLYVSFIALDCFCKIMVDKTLSGLCGLWVTRT